MPEHIWPLRMIDLTELCRVANQNCTPEMELLCMLFRRCLSNFTKTSRNVIQYLEFNPESSPGTMRQRVR